MDFLWSTSMLCLLDLHINYPCLSNAEDVGAGIKELGQSFICYQGCLYMMCMHGMPHMRCPSFREIPFSKTEHLLLPLLYPAINQLGLIFFTICGKGLPCLFCNYSEMQTLISFVFYGLVWALCYMSPCSLCFLHVHK